MEFLPDFDIVLLNGFLLIVPLLFIRLIIAKRINPNNIEKLDYFPPTIGIESIALKGYFISNTTLIFLPIICKINFQISITTFISIVIYITGVIFLYLSVSTFSKDEKLTTRGIYKISRNPMYIGYFLIFVTVGIAINSYGYLILTLFYQTCVHLLILSEERWCERNFGKDYIIYKSKTRRYL